MATSVDDLFTTSGDDAVIVHVHVQPAAGRTAVVGRHGTALKMRVAAPPVGGKANAACIELLAETFGVNADKIELVSGPSSRSKQFKLRGVDVEEFRAQLDRAVGAGRPAAATPGPETRQPRPGN